MPPRATPKSRHAKHRRWDLPASECRDCHRERARCQAKTRYLTQQAVNAQAAKLNAEMNYARMLAGYACPWCGFHHLTRAKPGTARWKRVEKKRRRSMFDAELDRRSA